MRISNSGLHRRIKTNPIGVAWFAGARCQTLFSLVAFANWYCSINREMAFVGVSDRVLPYPGRERKRWPTRMDLRPDDSALRHVLLVPEATKGA